MKKSTKKIENRTAAYSVQPIEIVRPAYILKQLMAIYLNELQGKEPLDLSDVTIPWTDIEDIPDEDELFPFSEVDALAAAEHAAGKEIYSKGIETEPCDYIEAVVDKYYSNNDSLAQFHFFLWYKQAQETLLDKCKEAELPIPKELSDDLCNASMFKALGAKQCKQLPDSVKKIKKQLPFEAKSCFEFDSATGSELIKHCLLQLYYLYNTYLYSYYVGARQFLAEEGKEGNEVNTAA